jgi:hypothetical protein
MTKKELKKIVAYCQSKPQIKLAYIFGSQANGETGPLSDYDFAFYVGIKDTSKIFNLQIKLINDLSDVIKVDSEKIDIVMLNTTKRPELLYNIIKEGKLIFEREPYRVLVEPKILMNYFDFHQMLLKYNQTKS